ncbi:single-stranded-DNA-specific exonuclease RecJ [Patescibacteria group bacterium]
MTKTQTASGKNWVLRPQADKNEINKFAELHPYLVQVLFNRNIKSQEEIDYFINPDYGRDLIDPFKFKQMDKAIARIVKAIKNKEKILVYGDYDADGVTAAVIMVEVLTELGAKPDIYLPYRQTEGYGLNDKAVKEFAKKKIDLIITIDCGTTNVVEVERANKLGMEVIIVDHHQQPPKLPLAHSIINPALKNETYPFKYLTSGGLAYKVATALLQKTDYGRTLNTKKNRPLGWEKWWLDLVAISTVADMAPLIGENRILVSFGLTVLRKTKRIGLHHLFTTMKAESANADTFTIGFLIGPRLNAAGRMDHASTAYQLLISTDEGEAQRLAEELHNSNQLRQKITTQMVDRAIEQVGEVRKQKILFAYDKSWQIGVVGLVAGKLSNRYHLPSIVMGNSESEIIGSGRSIPAYNIVAGLEYAAKHLKRYGGHPQACGFTVKSAGDKDNFIKTLTRHANRALEGIDTRPALEIDAQIDLEEVDWRLVEALGKLEPYGQGNDKPLFVAKDLEIIDIKTVGADDKHLKLTVKHNNHETFKTIGFTFGDWSRRVRIGELIDLVFEIGVNEWNGNREIELKIMDIKTHD